MNRGKQCVLIVDDEPLNIQTASKVLISAYNVKSAKDGMSCLSAVIRYEIDLILLDVTMPDMSGYEVLTALKEDDRTRDIPVIMVTSLDSEEAEVRALSLGAVDFLSKPIKPHVLRLRVETHLKIRRQMRLIEQFGLIDALTEIANRRSFDNRFRDEWARSIRSHTNLAVMMIDIDKFKSFNDTYGHNNGDIVLKAVAQVMQQTVKRGTDSVFRFGGEEFVILLSDTDLKGALHVAEQVRDAIASTKVQLSEHVVNVTVSIGVATTLPEDGGSGPALKRADTALYIAKDKGRNRVEVADESP